MADSILVARLTVIALLAYSGLSKLGSSNVAAAARDLGLSSRIASWVGQGLAPLELVVAGLLFFSSTAYYGAIAALALFVLFTALIGWNLWQGRTPACACFGEPGGRAISNWTLVRDLVFVALAAAVVVAGRAANQRGVIGELAGIMSALGWSASLSILLVLQIAFVLVLSARRSATPSTVPAPAPGAKASVEVAWGWPPGTLAPSFDLPTLEGQRVSLQSLLAEGRYLLLFFTAPNCVYCHALFPEIARWQEKHRDALTVALVSRGSAMANKAGTEEFGIRNLLLQGGAEVADAFQAMATPAAVVIDTNRRIASRVAIGAVAIRELAEAWIERSKTDAPVSVLSPPPPADPERVLVGDPAPPFKLPSVQGGDVDLADLAGRVTVLVFWRSTCGYCRSMASELRAREQQQTEASAQMVFIASGSRATNEAEGFASPLLLEENGSVSRAYGVNGTPSAILIDAESRVASDVTVGQVAIQALLLRADLLARAARRVLA